MQLSCLLLVISTFYFPPHQSLTAALFFLGLCLSRWGLWTFDLVQTQLLQERLPENDLAYVTGVEIALQNIFCIIAFVLTMIWANPEDFWLPAHLSIAAVMGGVLTFTCFWIRDRQHIPSHSSVLTGHEQSL
jgi:iron-regulated transporter 1